MMLTTTPAARIPSRVNLRRVLQGSLVQQNAERGRSSHRTTKSHPGSLAAEWAVSLLSLLERTEPVISSIKAMSRSQSELLEGDHRALHSFPWMHLSLSSPVFSQARGYGESPLERGFVAKLPQGPSGHSPNLLTAAHLLRGPNFRHRQPSRKPVPRRRKNGC